jgi:VanZ family protein
MFDWLRNVPVAARRLLFWAAMIFAFVMAILPHPPEIPGSPSDKVQHVSAFATLGLLGTWAYVRTSLVLLLAGLSLFGAFIEIVQAIPALHRDSDVKDWIADTIACGIVLLIIHWRRTRARAAAGQRP